MNKTLLVTALSAAFALVAPFASAETPDVAADLTAEAPMILAQAVQQAPQAGRGQKREFQLPSQRIETRLTAAKTALKISDSQNTLWENFAGVMRTQARAMDQRFQQRRAAWEAAKAQGGERAQRPQVGAIERLERRQQRLQEASARTNDVLAVAKPLYASFTPEQKQVADTMLAQRGHGHGHGQHRMHQRGEKPAA